MALGRDERIPGHHAWFSRACAPSLLGTPCVLSLLFSLASHRTQQDGLCPSNQGWFGSQAQMGLWHR